MPSAILELDRTPAARPAASHERLVISALSLACAAFAVAVWIAGPAMRHRNADVDAAMMTPTERLGLRRPDLGGAAPVLQPPSAATGARLSWMPDRLVNDVPPAALRAPIQVRGVLGIGSVDGLATIMWTEHGTTYWLTSPDRTTDELIAIAEGLR